MSSRRKCRLAIKNANEQTLRQAVEVLAKMLGAEVVNQVHVWRGTPIDVPCGLKMSGLSNGIGFRVERGEVVSDGDPYEQEQYHRVEALLKQTYGYMDSMNKLKAKGFTVDTSIKVFGNKIVANIVGMKYA